MTAPRDRNALSVFSSLLLECFGDEIAGEAFFGLLAERADADAFLTEIVTGIRWAESSMAAAMRHLAKRVASPEEIESAQLRGSADGHNFSQQLATSAWPALLNELQQSIPAYMVKYQRLLEAAPWPGERILQLLVEHERCLFTLSGHLLQGNQAGARLELRRLTRLLLSGSDW